MALDPLVVQLVRRRHAQQLLPKVGVERRLFVAFDPAAALPALGPALGQTIHDVFGIAAQRHLARLLEQRKGADDRHQLHAVVGGLRLAAADGALQRLVAQNRAPAAGAGVAAARAVGKNGDLLHDVLPLRHRGRRPMVSGRRNRCRLFALLYLFFLFYTRMRA